MNKDIRLLIVEDDENETKTWKMQIEQHTAIAQDSGDFKLLVTYASTREQALLLIQNSDFDAAIVDLNLATVAGHKEDNADGNEVIDALEKSELAVVIVYTGQPNDATFSGPKVKVISKAGPEGDGTKDVLAHLAESAPMILTIRAAEETIKGEMAALFSKSIWPRWKLWLNGNQEPNSAVTAAVTRHLASHVYAALLAKNGQKALSEEWYFVPPIREGLRTGDLVEISDYKIGKFKFGIVITPRCDLADNPGSLKDTYQIAACEDISAEWGKRHVAYTTALAAKPNDQHNSEAAKEWKDKFDKAQSNLRSLIQHRSKSNCHFLHQMRLTDGSTRGPFFVRFDRIMTFDRESDEGKALASSNPFASVAPEFLPSMVERLGTYFSRIGTPDFSYSE